MNGANKFGDWMLSYGPLLLLLLVAMAVAVWNIRLAYGTRSVTTVQRSAFDEVKACSESDSCSVVLRIRRQRSDAETCLDNANNMFHTWRCKQRYGLES